MDWTATLKSLAPTVASAFLGPLGGVAVAAVGNLLGVSDATQSKIADAIQSGQMTPEQVSKLKELELQYKNDEAERGFKYSELEFKDRDSARDMQTSVRSWVPPTLAMCITAGFFGILGAMLLGYAKQSNELMIMLGSLGTSWTGIIAFYFGSSVGSKEKTALLYQSTPTTKP
jgi:hypothetical protein